MGCAELSCLHVCLLSSEVKDLVPHISLLTNKASLHVLISSLLHCLACFLWCPLPTTSIPAKCCKVISKYSVEYLISKQQGPCIPRGTHSPYGQDKKKKHCSEVPVSYQGTAPSLELLLSKTNQST